MGASTMRLCGAGVVAPAVVHDESPGVRLQMYGTIHRKTDERRQRQEFGRVVSRIERVSTWSRTRDPNQVVDIMLAALSAGFGVETVWDRDLFEGATGTKV